MIQNTSSGRLKRKPRPLPNLTARALASPLFRQRIVKSKKAYSRKVKFKCDKNDTLD